MSANFETTERGLRLPPLRAPFSADDAAAINANYTLRVAGTIHGRIHERGVLPEPEDYDLVASEVLQLNDNRGDALFVEGRGHNGRPPVFSELSRLPSDIQMELVEKWRKNKQINTLWYAAGLASAQGVPVVAADISEAQLREIANLTGESEESLVHSMSPYAAYIKCVRETEAAHAVGTYALRGPQPLMPREASARPVYLTLFGTLHFDQQNGTGIPEAFARMGLETERRMLYSPEHLQRRRESLLQRLTEMVLQPS